MDVVLNGSNSNVNVEAQIDPTHAALRSSLRPTEHAQGGFIGGHYAMSAYFTMGAGLLNSPLAPVFGWKWGTDKLMLLKRVTAMATIKTPFGASQLVDVDVVKITSWDKAPSVQGGDGVISFKATSNKARSATMNGSLASSQGAIIISNGGPIALNPGTLDDNPFGYAQLAVQYGTGPANTGIALPPKQSLFEVRDFGQHPMVFGSNEGFAIRCVEALGATGVVKFGFDFVWAEVFSYDNR